MRITSISKFLVTKMATLSDATLSDTTLSDTTLSDTTSGPMKTVQVEVDPPSFPEAPFDVPLLPEAQRRWQVLCGDAGHYRVGIYSPAESSVEQLQQLETHDCPELFLLIEGELTLVLEQQGALHELPLQTGRPVLVTAAHNGFCPRGPHSGVALVVERDRFTTRYQQLADVGKRGPT